MVTIDTLLPRLVARRLSPGNEILHPYSNDETNSPQNLMEPV